MHTVWHWSVGHNAQGDAPDPAEITHGVTSREALAIMSERMREFAEIETEVGTDPAMARAFANAADFYDCDSELPGFETMLAMMEFQAQGFGPDSPHGTVSHVTGGIAFWAMPCYTEGCTEIENREE
jgi:hypothetical protein